MRIVIIGATAAGTTAAAKARRLASTAEIVMYEKGSITSFGACGLPYFIGDHFQDTNAMIARTPEQFIAGGIEVKIEHEAIALDIKAKKVTICNLATGEQFEDSYDQLLLACGAQAIIPPFAKNYKAYKNVAILRTLADGVALKALISNKELKNVAVIGGGYIGLEVATALHTQHKKVTLFELTEQLLSGSFDAEILKVLNTHLAELNDLEIKTATPVEAFTVDNDSVTQLITADNQAYAVDLVVLCTGVEPATAWLQNSGLQFYDNGAILVDEAGYTGLEGIYAAGDCATVYHKILKQPVYSALATVANKLGRVVGENLAGQKTAFTSFIGATGVKIGNLELNRLGLGEEEAKKAGFDIATATVTDFDHPSYYPNQEKITLKLIYRKASKQILGAQLIGARGAALRGHALSVAILKGLTTTELGLLDFAYNPAFARIWDILNVVGNVAK